MWAMSNKHQAIVKLLLDKGASKDIKSTSGRTAFDFAPPDGEMAAFLSQHGFQRNDLGLGEDFYDNGLSQDRFEQELEENEMRRRMMMESSINLEVDLSSLGMDEHEVSPVWLFDILYHRSSRSISPAVHKYAVAPTCVTLIRGSFDIVDV